MSNHIKIVVAGSTCSGKSTISRIIKNVLDDYGFKSVLIDEIIEDTPEYFNDDIPLSKRCKSIKERDTRIVIETLQVKKTGYSKSEKLICNDLLDHEVDPGTTFCKKCGFEFPLPKD